ncbi:MAG TPA: hypothetical protein VMQ10_12040 [Spirochaetia bacterium]|nr:hypothetical protein [Spirochaetia bacterium]
MKVMLVDEEGALRLRLGEALLETAGIELTLCPPDCGPEHDAVFAQVRRLVPDVVVLDVSMPAGGALGLNWTDQVTGTFTGRDCRLGRLLRRVPDTMRSRGR